MYHLKFTYDSQFHFTTPIVGHYFTVKAIPQSTDRQMIRNLSVSVDDYEFLNSGKDGFGNLTKYGSNSKEHTSFGFHIKGECELYEEQFEAERNPSTFLGIYLPQTQVTMVSNNMEHFFKQCPFYPTESNYQNAFHIMQYIYQAITYCQSATNISTTASEAFELKQGVCQDYAHLMISCLRYFKIPARYVVGMMAGEGYSHAWVEVYDKGYWFGFDPTNNQEVDHQYIKISHGRDYSDCMVIKGLFRGNALQSQDIKVCVEIEGQE